MTAHRRRRRRPQVEHAQIALPKANLGLVVGGQTASFRNLRLLVPAKVFTASISFSEVYR